jgi:hypothetical protein
LQVIQQILGRSLREHTVGVVRNALEDAGLVHARVFLEEVLLVFFVFLGSLVLIQLLSALEALIASLTLVGHL